MGCFFFLHTFLFAAGIFRSCRMKNRETYFRLPVIFTVFRFSLRPFSGAVFSVAPVL